MRFCAEILVRNDLLGDVIYSVADENENQYIAYYCADEFGDPCGYYGMEAPSAVGKYVALGYVAIDLDDDRELDYNEMFELALPFEIVPKELSDGDIMLSDGNIFWVWADELDGTFQISTYSGNMIVEAMNVE